MLKNKIKRIAFTGPFSDVNFGDYAMLVNNIYTLDIKNITIFSYDYKFSNKINNDYLEEYNTDVVEVLLNSKYGGTIENVPSTPVELLNEVKNYDDLVTSIKNINVLVVNGGGYFNGLWSKPHRVEKLLKIMAPILVANQLNKKIIFTGNSYGPFAGYVDFFSSFLGGLKNITFGCRDNLYSPVWMNQIGINVSMLEYIPDDLFLIRKKILSRKKTYTVKKDDYIVMETYLPVDLIKSTAENLIEFSEKIFKKYKLRIVFLPFNLAHGGLDQARYLNTILNNYDFIDISKSGYLPVQDAVQIIKGAKLVISTRYHALVIALAFKIPIVTVLKDVMGDKRYYYNKNRGMLDVAFKDIPFDERIYLKLDYLEALRFISDDYKKIIKEQIENYGFQYEKNKKNLEKVHDVFFRRINNLEF